MRCFVQVGVATYKTAAARRHSLTGNDWMGRHRMTTPTRRHLTLVLSLLASIAILAGTVAASEGTSGAATGGGHFLFSGFLDVEFGFGAVAKEDGSAYGSFHQ